MINIKNTRTIQPNWLKRLASCFMLTAALLLCMAAPLEYPTGSDIFPGKAFAKSNPSDMNNDGSVDLEDLKLYAEKKLGENWEKVDW